MPESPPVRRLGAAAPFDSSVDEATWLSTSPLKRSVLLTHILPDRSTPPGGSAGAVRVRIAQRRSFPDAGESQPKRRTPGGRAASTGGGGSKWSTRNSAPLPPETRLRQPATPRTARCGTDGSTKDAIRE